MGRQSRRRRENHVRRACARPLIEVDYAKLETRATAVALLPGQIFGLEFIKATGRTSYETALVGCGPRYYGKQEES